MKKNKTPASTFPLIVLILSILILAALCWGFFNKARETQIFQLTPTPQTINSNLYSPVPAMSSKPIGRPQSSPTSQPSPLPNKECPTVCFGTRCIHFPCRINQ